jgi:hypothetical protein
VTALLLLALAFLLPQLLIAMLNALTFPRLQPGDRSVRAPALSLLVPARDEAVNLRDTLPLMLQQEAAEILVLDDGSRDSTAELVTAAAAGDVRLRLLSGRPVPPGWNGKNWACHQLAEAASAELMLFVDADVRLAPGAVSAATARFAATGAGLLTLWPRQIAPSLLERAVVPQVDMVLLGALPHPLVRALPFASLAAGNGQFMLWDRSAYRSAGGHAAVRSKVLEDVRMAQLAKGAGVPLTLALGGELVAVRMYRSWSEVREGFAKNVLAGSGSRPALVALLLLNTLAYLVPWPLAFVDRRWLLPGLVGLALRALVALTTGRSPWEALLQPLAPLGLWPIAVRALRRGGGYRWKGRSYP